MGNHQLNIPMMKVIISKNHVNTAKSDSETAAAMAMPNDLLDFLVDSLLSLV